MSGFENHTYRFNSVLLDLIPTFKYVDNDTNWNVRKFINREDHIFTRIRKYVYTRCNI